MCQFHLWKVDHYIAHCLSSGPSWIANSFSYIYNNANGLLSLAGSVEEQQEEKKWIQQILIAVIFWIDVRQFNVMPLKCTPKDLQRDGQIGKMKSKKKLWNVKTMKIDGKKIRICLRSYIKFSMHDSLLKTLSETESPEVKVGAEIGLE